MFAYIIKTHFCRDKGEEVCSADESQKEENDLYREMMQLSTDFSSLSSFIESVQYVKFSPKTFFRHLWDCAATRGLSKDEHQKYVETMAMWGLFGNNLRRITDNGTPAQKKIISDCKRIYALTDGQRTTPTTVTLSRVSNVVAKMCSRTLHFNHNFNALIPSTEICDGYPRAMAFPYFGNLIPTLDIPDDDLSLLKKAFFLYKYRFDRKINRRSGNVSDKEKIMMYSMLQIDSDLYSQEVRATHCEEVGILTNDSDGGWTLTAAARPGVERAAQLWDALQ